eukprot:SAG22_NODE_6316_length_871_cov_2.239637_1_plen_102_part_00
MGAENEAHYHRLTRLARHVTDNTDLLVSAQSDIESHRDSLRGLGTGLRDVEHSAADRQAAVDRANRELSELYFTSIYKALEIFIPSLVSIIFMITKLNNIF